MDQISTWRRAVLDPTTLRGLFEPNWSAESELMIPLPGAQEPDWEAGIEPASVGGYVGEISARSSGRFRESLLSRPWQSEAATGFEPLTSTRQTSPGNARAWH